MSWKGKERAGTTAIAQRIAARMMYANVVE
jgi:hypothetical protein